MSLTICASRSPLTATSFQPMQAPYPRAWERVPVFAARHNRHCKIWKRVGGLPPPISDRKYSRTIAELDSREQGPRKRARLQSHFSAWEDHKYDPAVDRPRDGQEDLEIARGESTWSCSCRGLCG